MSADQNLRLVADVGGTQLRIGLAEPAGKSATLRDVEVVKSHEIEGVAEAIAAYWRRHQQPALAAVAVCVAGPVDGRGPAAKATLTNVDLSVSAQALSQAVGGAEARLINDFAAIAAATPALGLGDLDLHGPLPLPADVVTVSIGPGTGLGVAAWLPGGVLVAGEGGHARLAPPDAAAMPVWAQLAKEQAFISAERVLCGRGLVLLYQAEATLQGKPAAMSDAAAVWQAFTAGDPIARAAVSHFTAALGSYAGDLALIFGAQAVLLAGGILPRWGKQFDQQRFRSCFAAKEPEFQARLAAIPSATIIHPYPGLLGLASMPL